jgi:PST family polysaccharide transporter
VNGASSPASGPSLARASTWAAAGVASSHAVAFGTTLVLARLLSPSDFGTVALATVVTDVLYLLQDLGLSPALVQHRGDPRAAAASALRLHVAAGLVLALLLGVASDVPARALGDPAIAGILRVLGVGLVARAVGLAPRALLQRRLAFRELAAIDVGGRVSRAGVAIALAWRGAGAWSLVAGDLAMLAVQSMAAWLACGGVPVRAAVEPATRAALLGFGRSMTLASLVVWARDGATRTLIGVLLGPAALGYWQIAGRLAGAPVVGITHVTNRVALPVYASTASRAALRDTFAVTLRIVSMLALPACAGLLVVAPDVVRIGFGPRWMPIVTPLRCLLVASMLTTLAGTTGELFKALGRPIDLLRTAVPHLVLLVLAIPIGARYGLAGVACAIAGVRVAMAGVALAIARAHLDVPARAFLAPIAPAVAATALMLVTLAAMPALPASPTGLALAVRIAIGAAVYGVGQLAWRQLRPVSPRAIVS